MQSQKREDMMIFGFFGIAFVCFNIVLPVQSDRFANSMELTYVVSAFLAITIAFAFNRIVQWNKAKKQKSIEEQQAAEKGKHPKQKMKKKKN
ncbi:hypothetical protein [Desulfitobacterium sp. PCE1]|uniref:Uncharacterized protein n=2 Tax=Desulfitobacterium dehalogenans TaxID=36854 RepID=I4A588_DESDJ|nr:hypothetical protein [Desulfitobacterium sp. PCE1]AFL99122.1 hypothetical protein Desde_0673 [Desulfitobacterium dehalogenans ATCC 51507]HHY27745.1 hypothetical protein [Desulfitobacterium dehalogenans]